MYQLALILHEHCENINFRMNRLINQLAPRNEKSIVPDLLGLRWGRRRNLSSVSVDILEKTWIRIHGWRPIFTCSTKSLGKYAFDFIRFSFAPAFPAFKMWSGLLSGSLFGAFNRGSRNSCYFMHSLFSNFSRLGSASLRVCNNFGIAVSLQWWA